MKLYFCVLVICLLFSCKTENNNSETTVKTYTTIEQLNWLVGQWTNITEAEQSYENWTKTNDSTLKAHSFTIIKKDTVFAERMTLIQDKDNVNLTVIAYRQNNDKPVTFKLNSIKNKVFTFENSEHDFPSKIHYSNPVKDSIYAWIEGKIDDKQRTMDFYFKREK